MRVSEEICFSMYYSPAMMHTLFQTVFATCWKPVCRYYNFHERSIDLHTLAGRKFPMYAKEKKKKEPNLNRGRPCILKSNILVHVVRPEYSTSDSRIQQSRENVLETGIFLKIRVLT